MAKFTKQKKIHYSGIVKKSVLINAPTDKVWKKISNIVGLPEWGIDVKKTVYLSKIITELEQDNLHVDDIDKHL